jgi:hypothetical protein
MSRALLYSVCIVGIILVIIQGAVFADKTPVITPGKVVKNLTPSNTVHVSTPLAATTTLIDPGILKETGEISGKKIAVTEHGGDTDTPEMMAAAQSIVDIMELSEDELEESPYENCEWVNTGGSAGRIACPGPVSTYLDGSEYFYEYNGIAIRPDPGGSERVVLPLAVKQDAYIRYLKIVDSLAPFDENPAIRISSIRVYDGNDFVAGYQPQWMHYNERVHYVDLGGYFQFNKGLQISVSISNDEENHIDSFYITGYGARIEW